MKEIDTRTLIRDMDVDQARSQLNALDARLGEGIGATRERAKLQARIDIAPATVKKAERKAKRAKNHK